MLEMMAEAVGVTPKAMVIGLICFAIAFVIIFIKLKLDEKKGINSQEKEDIRKLVNNLVPDGSRYTAAYAHSTESLVGKEVYHYYAVGFCPEEADHLWVIPIGVESGKIVYTESIKMSAENLAYVGGNAHRLELHFPGTRDKVILSVDESNTKMGKECQVNIQQPEEAKAFVAFGEGFQSRVNKVLGVDKKGRQLK